MENLYNRVENLDEQIASVKLPYMAWKVLFLVDKDSESNKIASILEADANEVNSSLALLVENNLIMQSPGSVSDTTEEPEKEEVSETQPETPPAVEEIESPAEEVSEEPTSEVEASASDDDEFDVITETTEEEAVQESIEEIPEVEDSIVEPISSEENEPVNTEDEDIEIKISEEEEAAASADDNEFNFNLTGDADEAIKDAPIETPEEQTSSEVPEEQIDTAPADTSGSKNILVIDDSLVIRKMVEIALEDEDYIISTAVSGKEGLDSLDKINPDLVILDMMLPDINGIEILKTIKASKGIPVIMLSGKDSPQMIESAKNEGAEEFLPKPFKDDDLVEKIKNLLKAE